MKYFVGVLIAFLFLSFFLSEKELESVEPTQYPKGYPDAPKSVIKQLQSYPVPRYFKSNNLQYLFNWMDPTYMGGKGRDGVKKVTYLNNAIEIQKELFTNWHYGIVFSNSLGVDSLEIQLANNNPLIPLHVITFWMQLNLKPLGYSERKPFILNSNLDSSFYVSVEHKGKLYPQITYNFPDSLVKLDGQAQKFYLNNIVKRLTRPINLINENGEEPPGVPQLGLIKKKEKIVQLKNTMNIDSWEEFIARRKLQMRNMYTSSFMNEIPELKNTKFSFYQNEGGPINCFEWSIMKKIATPINGNYYSTPDFYPRRPKNWKNWEGPWHGWKWIDIGRQKEIKNGDNLFSPFVAAGWSKTQEEDIRPGQWLGLLKCLAGVGAEFYYVGYFSLSAPFTDPAKWAWQAAMPSYAQAITSRYEDVLREGNVLFDKQQNPIITYKTDDKHVLVTVRKHNKKEKYIICGTYQPFSNEMGEIPEKKNVTVSFSDNELSFEVRRQGSVYVYEKTPEGKTVFYQLDAWHENSHPDYWSQDFYFEAEVSDNVISNNSIFTIAKNENDYSDYLTYISLSKNMGTSYRYNCRDSLSAPKYVWLKYRGAGKLCLNFKQEASEAMCQQEKLPKTMGWNWYKIKINQGTTGEKEISLSLTALRGIIDVDKVVLSSSDKTPTY